MSNGEDSTFDKSTRPSTMAENLHMVIARLSEHLSPAERDELEEAALALSQSKSDLESKIIQYGYLRQRRRIADAEYAFRQIQVALRAPLSAASTSEDRIAEDAIDLFLEYRDKHGRDEQAAKAAALNEFAEARSAEVQASPSSEQARFTGDDQLLADLDSAFITDDLAPQALKDLCRLASVALADANYWRARHCRESEAAGKQSHEHWQKWKDAEARLAAVSHELPPYPPVYHTQRTGARDEAPKPMVMQEHYDELRALIAGSAKLTNEGDKHG